MFDWRSCISFLFVECKANPKVLGAQQCIDCTVPDIEKLLSTLRTNHHAYRGLGLVNCLAILWMLAVFHES